MELNNLNKFKIIFIGLFIILLIVAVYSQQGPFVGTNPPAGQYHHISEIWINEPLIDWKGLEFINISKLVVNEIVANKINATQICIEEVCLLNCKKYYGYIGYSYVRPVYITERSGNNLTNYQVLITLDTRTLISQGKMRSDCGDIKFLDFNKLNSLSYWIEPNTCNTYNTRIWVKVPLIQANSNETIFMYYGNPDVASMSSGEATFIRYNLTFDGPIGGRTSLGGDHTCALLSNGSIACWGYNGYGQLGDATTTPRYIPVLVQNINNAVAIAAGLLHTCALLSNGSIACWGANYRGQLGDGTTTDRNTPVLVQNINNAIAIAAGLLHTCALLSNGSIACWGYNAFGQLGDGTTTDRYTPVLVINYNLGGRYDKTGGILTPQRSPPFYDWYFIRKYSPIEPLVSLGDEEKI